MKFQDTLNTKLWDLETNDLQPEVKSKLEEIADAFIEYIEIPQDAILDMVITGSSASYNYNEHSDLDLHIIVDYDKIHDDCPLVEGYLGALKNTFNKEHDIFIHGVPVELYAEQKDQGTVHNGLYSLNTGWIDEPQKIPPTDNDAAVEAKFNEIKEMVDKCNDSEEADELLDKIYNMRKAGLAAAGEFCTENLAFKKLRNEGCMDKLRQIKKEKIDKQLSLESYSEDFQKLNLEDFKIEKTDSGLYKVAYDGRIGYIKPDKSYSKVQRALGNAVYKYNTKFIQTDRKALISKLHKLFKQAGIPKMEDMTSSIRGYRPITKNGYYIDIYPGDRTSFIIGLSNSNEEYFNKIKQILDQEGISYSQMTDHFDIDMEKQNIKNESIKEDYKGYSSSIELKAVERKNTKKLFELFESFNNLTDLEKALKEQDIDVVLYTRFGSQKFTGYNLGELEDNIYSAFEYTYDSVEIDSALDAYNKVNNSLIVGNINLELEKFDYNESIKEDHTFIDEYEVSETRGDWIITKDFNYNFASQVAAISNNLKVYLSYYDHELIKDYKGEETYNDIKWDDDEVPNLLSVEDALYYIGLPNSFPTEEFKKAVVDINDDIKANYDAYWDTYHERHGLPKPNKNESIKEDYEDDDYEDIPEEMHKERYVTYFETLEGRQKYTIYHVYTDSTDDSYNELCDKRDNQLGMYDSYQALKDALKERAEKIAKQQGWTVKSIENLGEDDEYYRERNKWESIKETQDKFNKNESINEEDDKFNYMMLGRLKQDCEYFLGNGNGHEKHLWAGNVEDQIGEMRKIYDKLPEKPEWLSLEDIDKYEKDMLEKRDSKNESFTDIHKELNKYMNESKENMLKTIADEVYAEIQRLYDNDKDLMEYVVVDYDIRKYNDGSNMYVIEVRNELSYEGMVSLAEKLDKVVQKYDKTAYFDQVDGGIMDAVLDLDNNQTNTDMSFVEIKESLDKYSNYFQLEETKGSYRSFIKKYIDEHPECKDKKANKVYFDIAKEWDKQEPKPEHSLHVFKDTAIDYIKSFLKDAKKNENLNLTLTCLNKQLDKFLS